MTLAGGRASVVVIGGGLAGISAAIDLADAGLQVTLLEARPWLGGATWSFARRGLTIDNGQHVFLRCCLAYRELLARLGVAGCGPVQDELDLTVLGPDALARVRRSGLPAPWHLARSLAGYRLLSRLERAKVATAALALQFVDIAGREDRSLDDWLARHGQDERARRLFWDQLSLSALNVNSESADLAMAASAIRTAVLSRRDSADLGVPSVPLSHLHGNPAAELLRQLRVMVRLGVRVSSLRAGAAGGWDIGLAYGEHTGTAQGVDIRQGTLFENGPARIHAAGVVLAVPAWEAAVLAPDSLAGDAPRWAQLEPSPVMSIHVIYGSRVTRLPFAAAAGSPVHWVMDKTAPSGLHAGQYLAASVRAAGAYLDTPAAQLRAEFLPAMERLFPAAAEASVEDFFVTRERRATIAHVPGSQRLRLAQAGPAGFAMAGAWTDTGWPDTMEGAVRSGQAAAQKLMAELPARAKVPAARVPAAGVPAARVRATTLPASTVPAVTALAIRGSVAPGPGPAPAPAPAAPESTPPAPTSTAPASTAEASAAEVSAAEVSAAEVSAAEVSAAEVSAAEVSAAEVSAAETSTAEPSASQAGIGAGETDAVDAAGPGPAGDPEGANGQVAAEGPDVVGDPARAKARRARGGPDVPATTSTATTSTAATQHVSSSA